ncbi:hypothetical protein NADFUDRAFT_64853 [Nadsonia fulvescens var. elongata DSM 6958]|uniref:Uncharacterized protein n=1 Tax=Nadsonia fulvescens var. elongata DSM 6958 TaxID=857566 RepID=A0A1E3PLR4_9ASCO|nr:hypothetical protein NADFUDRAFT_64853 [Nadsonia fulvescens var. elongata DSM 6958]
MGSDIFLYGLSVILSALQYVWGLARPALATLPTANPDLASLAMLLVVFYVSLRIATHTVSVMYNAFRRMFTVALVASAGGLLMTGVSRLWPNAIPFASQKLNLNYWGSSIFNNTSDATPAPVHFFLLKAYEGAQLVWNTATEDGLQPETLLNRLEQYVNAQ